MEGEFSFINTLSCFLLHTPPFPVLSTYSGSCTYSQQDCVSWYSVLFTSIYSLLRYPIHFTFDRVFFFFFCKDTNLTAMSSSILHQCPSCGHISDISQSLAAFIENPHCTQVVS
jgi:hypothetical protein